MNNIKVLHVLRSNFFSGAENVVCQIIDMFKDDNYDMAYCSIDGQIRESLKERNIRFFPLSKFNITEIRKVIKEYKPDIIHAHDAYASVIATLAGKSIRIISHMHGNHEDLRKISIKSLMYNYCSKKFDHIFWVSKSAYNDYYFKKKICTKSTILYNIINRDDVIKKMNKDKNFYNYDIIYVGRLSNPKNPFRLIHILKKVIEMKPSIKVAIVGTGIMKDESIKLASELGISNNLNFLGFMNNPYKILHDSKVMLMTSVYEGTPMAALEAMALGVPIVSTPTDGIIDVVDNGVTGFLSNDNNDLVQKLLSIISNNDLRSKLSRASIDKFIRMNDLNQYKNELIKYYSIKS